LNREYVAHTRKAICLPASENATRKWIAAVKSIPSETGRESDAGGIGRVPVLVFPRNVTKAEMAIAIPISLCYGQRLGERTWKQG
jgi:hypothetical protein